MPTPRPLPASGTHDLTCGCRCWAPRPGWARIAGTLADGVAWPLWCWAARSWRAAWRSVWRGPAWAGRGCRGASVSLLVALAAASVAALRAERVAAQPGLRAGRGGRRGHGGRDGRLRPAHGHRRVRRPGRLAAGRAPGHRPRPHPRPRAHRSWCSAAPTTRRCRSVRPCGCTAGWCRPTTATSPRCSGRAAPPSVVARPGPWWRGGRRRPAGAARLGGAPARRAAGAGAGPGRR